MNGGTNPRNNAFTVAGMQRSILFENSSCFPGWKRNLVIDLRHSNKSACSRMDGAATRNPQIRKTRIFNNTLSVHASVRAHSETLRHTPEERQAFET